MNTDPLVIPPSLPLGECGSTITLGICLLFSSSRSRPEDLIRVPILDDILMGIRSAWPGLWAQSLVEDAHSSIPVVVMVMNAKEVLKL